MLELMPHPAKSGLLCLFFTLVVGSASGAGAKPRGGGLPLVQFELPPVPIVFSSAASPRFAVEVRRAEVSGVGCAGAYPLWFRCRCGWGGRFESPQRVTRLPDPVLAMAEAFRGCRAIQAAVLDLRVPVASCPEGFFGDWVHEGVLVVQRLEIADETTIQRVFALLVEAVGPPDDALEFWIEEPTLEPAVADYRQETGFVPELAVEFVGVVPLRVEISLTQQRLLVQAGDKWDGYALDRWSAASLKELLSTPAGEPRPHQGASVVAHGPR